MAAQLLLIVTRVLSRGNGYLAVSARVLLFRLSSSRASRREGDIPPAALSWIARRIVVDDDRDSDHGRLSGKRSAEIDQEHDRDGRRDVRTGPGVVRTILRSHSGLRPAAIGAIVLTY